MTRSFFLIPIFLFLSVSPLLGQDEDEIAKATEFSVPSSPAFNLLDINPSKVNRPGVLQDFKLDWVMNDGGLAPNIAIESNLIWLLAFRKSNLTKYQEEGFLNSLKRVLSTTNFSLGTSENDSIRSIAGSLKLTLWRKNDPLMDKAYLAKIKREIVVDTHLEQRLINLEAQLEYASNAADSSGINAEIAQVEQLINMKDEERKEKIKTLQKKYTENNWNNSAIDFGIGRLLHYSDQSFEDMQMAKESTGLWLNSAFNLNKSWLVSGLVKAIIMDNSSHSDNWFFGGNIRYGKKRMNGFVEYVYETNNQELQAAANTIAYGGNFEVNRSLKIEFGIRHTYEENIQLKDLEPILNLKYVIDKSN